MLSGGFGTLPKPKTLDVDWPKGVDILVTSRAFNGMVQEPR